MAVFRESSQSITWKIFREINFIVRLFTKEVVLTEIFQKTRDTKISETPHCAVWKLRKTLTHFWQKFRENNVFTNEFTK